MTDNAAKAWFTAIVALQACWVALLVYIAYHFISKFW
jgi:hypothetical protein